VVPIAARRHRRNNVDPAAEPSFHILFDLNSRDAARSLEEVEGDLRGFRIALIADREEAARAFVFVLWAARDARRSRGRVRKKDGGGVDARGGLGRRRKNGRLGGWKRGGSAWGRDGGRGTRGRRRGRCRRRGWAGAEEERHK
jgi:hypothetical protein